MAYFNRIGRYSSHEVRLRRLVEGVERPKQKGVDIFIAIDMLTKAFQKLQEDLQRLEDSIGMRIIRKTFSDTDVQFVIRCCGAKIRPNVSSILERHNFLELPAIIYRDGWEWYRMVAFKQNDVIRFFQDLSMFANVEFVLRTNNSEFSARENVMISTNNLLGLLT